MNALKLKKIVDGVWLLLPYDEFREKSKQEVVVLKQRESVMFNLNLWVLNTSLFFLIDYKGRTYYESLVREYGQLFN